MHGTGEGIGDIGHFIYLCIFCSLYDYFVVSCDPLTTIKEEALKSGPFEAGDGSG